MEDFSGKAFKNRILDRIKPQKPSPWGLSIGLDHGLINRIFNEEKIPTAKHILTISRALGVSIDWLLTGEEPVREKEREAVEEGALPGLSPLERVYVDRLLEIIRTKDQGTVSAITQNIDTFLRVPSVKEEHPPFTQEAGEGKKKKRA